MSSTAHKVRDFFSNCALAFIRLVSYRQGVRVQIVGSTLLLIAALNFTRMTANFGRLGL